MDKEMGPKKSGRKTKIKEGRHWDVNIIDKDRRP